MDFERWTAHSTMSDPVGYRPAVARLPADIGQLSRIIQGVLIHGSWLSEYGLGGGPGQANSRTTLPVAERFADVFEKHAGSLELARAPAERSVGTCRDFALMLCSMLRSKGIPARVRCGFAAYFGDGWEDHWVCESWDAASRRWRLSDPQLDDVIRSRCRIDFDPADIPRRSFRTAGEAWLDCRDGKADAATFGHGAVTGLWFMQVNVVRDHYVLNGRETSAWDGWRDAPPSARIVHDEELAAVDYLAAFPGCRVTEKVPEWSIL